MSISDLNWPPHLERFAQQQAAEEGFQSADQYVQYLVEKEAKRKEKLRELETELVKGVNSGSSIPVTQDSWQKFQNELRERYLSKKNG